MYEDITLTCRICGQPFVHTARDQAFYAEKGYVNLPKACKACRAAKNAAGAQKPKEPRPTYTYVCARCGGEAIVSFQKDPPVYCKACYAAIKNGEDPSPIKKPEPKAEAPTAEAPAAEVPEAEKPETEEA